MKNGPAVKIKIKQQRKKNWLRKNTLGSYGGPR